MLTHYDHQAQVLYQVIANTSSQTLTLTLYFFMELHDFFNMFFFSHKEMMGQLAQASPVNTDCSTDVSEVSVQGQVTSASLKGMEAWTYTLSMKQVWKTVPA